jgi:hypothetical protein
MDFNIKRKPLKEVSDHVVSKSPGVPLVGGELMDANPEEIKRFVEGAKIRFKEEIARLDLSVKEAGEIAVIDDPTHKLAISKAGELKKLVKAFEFRRKEIIGPARSFFDEVNKFCRIIKDRADAALELYNDKVTAYSAKLEAERRALEAKQKAEAEALQKKLDAEAKAGGYEAPTVEVTPVKEETVTRTDNGTSAHIRKDWTFEVVDFSKVDDRYKVINEKQINADIRAGIREAAGLRIFQKERTVFRT